MRGALRSPNAAYEICAPSGKLYSFQERNNITSGRLPGTSGNGSIVVVVSDDLFVNHPSSRELAIFSDSEEAPEQCRGCKLRRS